MKPLQAAILPVSAGWSWIFHGYALFSRQPLAMIFWSVMTSLFINLGLLFPILGQAILIVLTPALTFLTLSAGQHLAENRRILPGMWLQPLKQAGTLRALLRLGWAYLAGSFLVALLAVLPFASRLVDAAGTGSTPDIEALSRVMGGPLITFGLLYVLLSALFWHTPALVGWHQLPLRRALFYSMVACWRSKYAILLYVASWAATYLGLHEIFSLALTAGGSPETIAWLMMPFDILLTALLYCSFYPIYASIFK